MRKNIIFILVLCLCGLLSSCDHEHTYSDNWSYDDNNHWHKATCEHLEEKVDFDVHEWVKDEKIDPNCETTGQQTYKCLCGATKSEAISSLGHNWIEADYENPKTCDRCGATEGEPLTKPDLSETFILLTEFNTPVAYASPVKEKWEYQASVQNDIVYFYVIQHFGSDVENGEIIDLTLNHILIETGIGDFVLCSNGAYEVKNNANIDSVEYLVKNDDINQTEYYLKVKLLNHLNADLAVNFYSFDSKNQNSYGYSDVCFYVDEICYHTHFIEKLYIGDEIKFKPETLYETDEYNQSPIPEKWGYAMQSTKEGLYIYVYQEVDKVVYGNGQDWSATHIEFSIFHHSFGVGATLGYVAETYVGVWPNKTYYINNSNNVLAVDLKSTEVTGNRIEYRIFIRFNNNLENPKDGPYAFVKVRTFDPKDNNQPYSNEDVVEYRDNRFVHTIEGDSLFVYEKVTKIDNPYETSYLDSRIQKWNNENFQNTENMTLFIGDSFFESDNWWVNFYNDYQNKACFTSAIGGTKVTQWLNWLPSLVDPFAAKVENIVIHLGYNDVNSTGITAVQLEMHLEDLFARLHSSYPEANIYYFGIGTSYWFQYSNNTRAKETDNLTKAFAETCDYVTFIDMDLCYQAYMDETGGTLESFFKDGTHPKNENYKYLIAALEEAGCVISYKN